MMAKKSKASNNNKAAKDLSKQSNNASSNGAKQVKAPPAPSPKTNPPPAGSKKPKVSAVHARQPKATPKQVRTLQPPPVVSKKAKNAAGKLQQPLAVPQTSNQAAGRAVYPAQVIPRKTNVSGSCQAVRCAENIALLGLLTLLPAELTDGPPHGQSENARSQPTRTLTFKEESKLATTLAFLSGISDDGNHVTAVCLEEVSTTGGCKVLIAINKHNPDRGNEIQGRIHRGFKQIFGQLARMSPSMSLWPIFSCSLARVRSRNCIRRITLMGNSFTASPVVLIILISASSKDARMAIREAVFNSIVALCHDRILTRLGLRKSKKAYSEKPRKKSIRSILVAVLKTQWQSRANAHQPEMKQEDIRRYRLQSEALLTNLYELEAKGDPKHDDTVQCVRSIAIYMAEVPLKDLFGYLSLQNVPRESQERLFNCLSKIARYRESATLLCRMAKRFVMLREATMEEVHLPREAFAKPPKGTFTGNVQSILTRLSQKQNVQTHNLPPWVQKAIAATPSNEFTAEINNRLQDSRIHAEIQILAHYEDASSDVVPPRIIASSKNACYLCDTFIRLHRGFSVPKTHGKLYPGWRLPTMPQLDPLQQRLNGLLEEKILAMIKKLSQTGVKPVNKFINESTIFPLHLSASALTSLSNHSSADLPSRVGRVETKDRTPARTVDEDADATVSKDIFAVSHDENSRLENKSGRDGLNSVYDDHDEAQVGSLVDLNEKHMLSEIGNDSSCAFVTSSGGTPSLLPQPVTDGDGWFRYNNMEIFIDSPLEVPPKWLSPADSIAVLSNKAEPVVNVFSMPPGTEISPLPKNADEKTYFSFGDQVIMIDTGGR